MGCYHYYAIFQEYGSQLRSMLLDPTDRPYPLYERRQDFENDTSKYKGFLVWESHRYYKSIVEPDPNLSDDVYTNDIGYFIVPEFGQVTAVPNLEYRQMVVIAFDTNVEPDYDPYEAKIMKTIDWFLNKHEQLIESLNTGFILNSGTHLYAHLQTVGGPIRRQSNYVRRAVTITVRYCKCS